MSVKNTSISEMIKETIASIIEKPNLTIRRENYLNTDLDLYSLKMAQLILTLENQMGVDPFADTLLISDMQTVGDLIDAYEQTLGMMRKTA